MKIRPGSVEEAREEARDAIKKADRLVLLAEDADGTQHVAIYWEVAGLPDVTVRLVEAFAKAHAQEKGIRPPPETIN
jgi:hypothetical protein